MSEQRKDGGPAFPHMYNGVHPDNGMSLRDYFAGQAMSALILANGGDVTSLSVGAAKDAYAAAAGMIAARAALSEERAGE